MEQAVWQGGVTFQSSLDTEMPESIQDTMSFLLEPQEIQELENSSTSLTS